MAWANWTFIVWGALNALFFLPLLLTKKNRTYLDIVAQDRWLPTPGEILRMGATFGATVIAWVFFRAESITHAVTYLKGIFSVSFFTMPKGDHFIGSAIHPLAMFILLGVFILIEWIGRKQEYAIALTEIKWKRPVRFSFYYVLIIAIFWFGGQKQEFIYFQF